MKDYDECENSLNLSNERKLSLFLLIYLIGSSEEIRKYILRRHTVS